MALRESGYVDFYWRYFRVSCSEEYDTQLFYDDIELTFSGIYIKERNTNKVKEIQAKWNGRVGIEVAGDGSIL